MSLPALGTRANPSPCGLDRKYAKALLWPVRLEVGAPEASVIAGTSR
jgi:hypothetical protein